MARAEGGRGRGEPGGEPARRRQILDAATRVFARKGYFGSRVADIAQEAGIAYGLIYHYFRNKEGLLLAIFHETWNLLLERIRTVQSQPVDAGSKLRQIARFLLEGFRSNPDLFEVLVVEVIRSSKLWETDTLSRIGEAFRLLEQMVEEGKRAGDFGPELDSRLACSIFYGALDQIITDWVVGLRPSGDQDVERAIGMVETVILGGMGMGAPAKGRAS